MCKETYNLQAFRVDNARRQFNLQAFRIKVSFPSDVEDTSELIKRVQYREKTVYRLYPVKVLKVWGKGWVWHLVATLRPITY